MSETIQKNIRLPFIAVIFTILFKLLFLLTQHIQEDAFITWRVAQNLLDYGVIGFNGPEKISASTTHLYVLISYLFNLLLGKENFMYPLLVFNSLLFTFGSYFLSKLLLKSPLHQALFIFLFGILPPSIKISILGMEYGLLFFLEMALLYFGFQKNKIWAQILFPVLILFTRIDTVIFLGIVFLIDLIWSRKIRWYYILGGLLAVAVSMGFNWFYFGEIVNNTIKAKSATYAKDMSPGLQWQYFLLNYGNFWGMLKLPGNLNPYTLLVLLFELLSFIYIVTKREGRNLFVWIIFVFAWTKQLIFISQRSYFDWYYWVPQILLFSIILVFILEQQKQKWWWFSLLLVFYIIPMAAFQTVHSIATGNGEWNYRRSIGLFLKNYEKDKTQYILLEPAGYIPYFSGLKAIDEVGLVDVDIQKEIRTDKAHYWKNTVAKRKPKYLLSPKDLFTGEDAIFYRQHYRLLKAFRIKNHLHAENKIIEKIYHLKPSGTDYNLYERK